MLGGSGNIINLNVQPLQTGTGKIIDALHHCFPVYSIIEIMYCIIDLRNLQSLK